LCIIETVLAIFREYKPWILLLITQWSNSFKMLALSLGLLRNAKILQKNCLPFLVRKRQRRSQLSHLIGYIKRHLKLWDNKIGPKYKISSECSLSQNNKKHYCNIFS
jgi:hypothetical protein